MILFSSRKFELWPLLVKWQKWKSNSEVVNSYEVSILPVNKKKQLLHELVEQSSKDGHGDKLPSGTL